MSIFGVFEAIAEFAAGLYDALMDFLFSLNGETAAQMAEHAAPEAAYVDDASSARDFTPGGLENDRGIVPTGIDFIL